MIQERSRLRVFLHIYSRKFYIKKANGPQLDSIAANVAVGSNGINASAAGAAGERDRFLNGGGGGSSGHNEPVRLTPAWEENNLSNDELNMKGMTMERAKMEIDPPRDRMNLIFLTLVLHGIGTLMPWNMFITAKDVILEERSNFRHALTATTATFCLVFCRL